MSRRLHWYEDDVVTYTCSGKHPIIPDKYKYCYIKIDNVWHKFKSFYNIYHARISLQRAAYPYYRYINTDKKIFRCPYCQMYHITTKKNYGKLQIHD